MSNDQPTPDVETVLAAVMRAWGVRSRHGEWSDEEAQRAAARDAAAVLEPLIREREAKAWDEGWGRAEYMARCWGHTDSWGEEDPYPSNPYRAATLREQP